MFVLDRCLDLAIVVSWQMRTSGPNQMRAVFGTICLLIAATPAMAVTSVPAPLVGGGIAAMAAVGGVLLASRLFKRN